MSVTQQKVTAQPAARPTAVVAPTVPAPLAVLAQKFGNANLGRFLQAKLTVSNPGDPFEQEADRVADQVMRGIVVQRASSIHEEDPHRTVSAAAGLDAELESSIRSLSGRGSPLPPSVRSFMEPRFKADFTAVRVHDDAQAHGLARAVSARAFTVGRDVVFGAGHFAPDTDTGRQLLAHELTHVLQQGAAPPTAGTVVQRDVDPAQISVSEPPVERRQSLGAAWYVEMDPATSIVAAGTEVTFHLRNSQNLEIQQWEEEVPGFGQKPVFILTDAKGQHWRGKTTIIKPYHSAYKTTLNTPGKYRAAFWGRPIERHGDSTRSSGTEILVSVDFDVLGDLTADKPVAADVAATSARDLQHFEDSEASEGEIAAAFERIAVRRAFAVLEDNRQEAEEQLALYTRGAGGKTAGQAAEALHAVAEFDFLLQRHWELTFHADSVKREADKAGRRDLVGFQQERRQKLAELRATLIEAFPALGVIHRDQEESVRNLGKSPSELQTVVQAGLRKVLVDIEATKHLLASGELPILDVAPILAETRKALSVDANPRVRGSVDKLLKNRASAELKQGLVLGATQLLLLFVPGIGPYLAAALGIGLAARSWKKVGELQTAAGAGVRAGLIDQDELDRAAFWAAVDTIFAALDLGTTAKEAFEVAKKVVPQVRNAVGRITGREAEATAGVLNGAERLSESAGSTKGGARFFITGDDLQDLATRLFKRPINEMREQVHVYETVEAYEAEFVRNWPGIGRPRAAAYFDPRTGHIHLSPNATLMTAVHEAVHKVAHETFPLGRQLLGDFLDEGITEAFTRELLGPRPFAAGRYTSNIEFVARLQRKLGPDVVRNAVLHGDYRSLRDAVKQLFSGSEQLTFDFFNKLRSLGDVVAERDRQTLEELNAMLGRGESKTASSASKDAGAARPPRRERPAHSDQPDEISDGVPKEPHDEHTAETKPFRDGRPQAPEPLAERLRIERIDGFEIALQPELDNGVLKVRIIGWSRQAAAKTAESEKTLASGFRVIRLLEKLITDAEAASAHTLRITGEGGVLSSLREDSRLVARYGGKVTQRTPETAVIDIPLPVPKSGQK